MGVKMENPTFGRFFYFKISFLYFFIVLIENLFTMLLPFSMNLMLIESKFMSEWQSFIAEKSFWVNFLTFLSFFIPILLCFFYIFIIFYKKDELKLKCMILNLPTIFSCVGLSGWGFNLISEIPLLLYAKAVIGLKIGNIFLISAMFLFLEGLLSFEVSYFTLETLNRTWILPKLFPNGNISKLNKIVKPLFSFMFLLLFLTVSICPVFFSLYTSIAILYNNGIPLQIDSFIMILIIMLISAIVTFFFMKIFTVPLKKLSCATKMIKVGDFSQKVKIISNDEMGLLGDTFNEMIDSLKEKEFMRDTFGKVVDPYVRDYFLKGNIALGGENQNVTVMFCDIRGFTSLSEKMKPEDVVSLLNLYFTKIGKCISNNHGIINKYIGDAVMAVFGVPVLSEKHADEAFYAAKEMKIALKELNLEFAKKGFPQINFGIGIHSGNVLAGNIGASERMEYTVIGDTVNTASRIESLCKTYKTDILVSENTFELLKDKQIIQELHFVDNAQIRGKINKVRLYSTSN